MSVFYSLRKCERCSTVDGYSPAGPKSPSRPWSAARFLCRRRFAGRSCGSRQILEISTSVASEDPRHAQIARRDGTEPLCGSFRWARIGGSYSELARFADPALTADILNRMAAQSMNLNLRAKLLEMAVEAESEAREQEILARSSPILADATPDRVKTR